MGYCLQGADLQELWWAVLGLNQWPLPCQGVVEPVILAEHRV